ncbi:Der GTPase-activating protein YihI [Pseudocolwellia sp. HL-MZ7]|uniref:Der GTPase-activating protein YihI n=1 Tax=Pseudocolwellia sp. HL-MZ7 TaxID=3400627 RepID=UPI003CF43494
MSRVKKSRKPGVGKREVLSEADKKLIVPTPKRAKKKVGKEPGNRQKEAFENKTQNQTNNAPKDPRLGSKVLIDLTPQAAPKVTTNTNKPKKEKQSPIAAIRMVEPEKEPNSALEDELYAIEDDQQLQSILALQEEDKSLSEEQIDYFNEKMERHQELRELLGWDDEESEDDEDDSQSKSSEDDLWDSLDTTDLSKY